MNGYEEKGAKVLIVDDNLKNIQVLGNILKEANYTIGFATDGRQALGFLKKTKFELVLLDVNMPVMNGYETCKEIRKDQELKEIPVIFITANRDVENVVEGFEAGAQDYVTKPFNAKELLSRVNTQLQLKNQSDEIKKMNRRLERKVAERTAELVEANNKLSQLDKAKSDLLILLSHELRTPLSGILGFAQILLDGIKDDEQKEFVRLLIDSAKRLLNFSETALLITSLKLKTYNLEFRIHNLADHIDNSIKKLSAKIKEKNLALNKEIIDGDISVSADIDLIAIAFQNILENAVKASPENGNININISKNAGFVVIAVSDEGKGFSREAIDQLFEFFSTTDVMHHFEGYGLGLASVRLIMDIHNGKAVVRNLEKGAEVSLLLPLIE
jgi:two-component system sensor histidine kinase/response regulator